MEFILTTDLATIPQEICFNDAELEKQLTESLERYNSLVVTEDSIQPAKKDRAALNKLKAAIDDKRKEVRKACLAHYETFELRTKKLTGMIQQPVDSIDKQLKAFEEFKRNEKYAAIEAFYSENIGDLAELLPLDKIVPEKWANTTVTLESATSEISEKITKARNDYGIICKMALAHEAQALDVYFHTLDMSQALAESKRLEEQAAKVAAMEKARREQEKQQAQEFQPTPPPITEYTQPTMQEVAAAAEAQEETKTISVTFYDTTEAFRAEMKALTEKHGIKYGSVK